MKTMIIRKPAEFVNCEKTLRKYASDILQSKEMFSCFKFTQHGNVSVFSHCVMVAVVSLKIADRLGLKVDERALTRGALLHDFFLYDWHNIPSEIKKRGLHGFKHPVIAAENAKKYFRLSEKEYGIIINHMFPLTITRVPASREAWLVCLADKCCSCLETLKIQKYNDDKIKKIFGVLKY